MIIDFHTHTFPDQIAASAIARLSDKANIPAYSSGTAGGLLLAERAVAAGTPIISSMGAGNKMDPSAFEVADIYETSVCPLARVMRRELKKRGVKHLKVVYSKEPPLTPIDDMAISCRSHCICPPGTARKCTQRRQVPGSNAFVPATVGLIIAGEVINDLTGFRHSNG